jgi:hypothetical protein
MLPYGSAKLIELISKTYDVLPTLIKVAVGEILYGSDKDVDMSDAREISLEMVNHGGCIQDIRVPSPEMYSESEFYDLIIHQIRYTVLQDNYEPSMKVFFSVKEGVITDRKTCKSVILYKNEYVLCEPAIMYTRSSKLMALVQKNLLIIFIPKNIILIKDIEKKKFDGSGLWVDLHLVALRAMNNTHSLDKCSVRITSTSSNGDLDSASHQTELIHEAWMNNFNIPADMFKNPLNGSIQELFSLLEPNNLYDGNNIYTDRNLCTFIRIANSWIAVEWNWLFHNREQFSIEIQEEITMAENIRDVDNR